MRINNVAWIAVLIVVALSASLIAARIVTASTDAGTAVDEPSLLAQAEFSPADLPMCQRIGARGVRIEGAQTWAADAEVILTLDESCVIGKARTNAVGSFSVLLPLAHQKHYTETVGTGTSRSLVPKRTQAQVYVNGVRASYAIPYTVSDVDIFQLSNAVNGLVTRAKPNPKLTRVAVSHGYTADWVGVFSFKMITLYPEMSMMGTVAAQ